MGGQRGELENISIIDHSQKDKLSLQWKECNQDIDENDPTAQHSMLKVQPNR